MKRYTIERLCTMTESFYVFADSETEACEMAAGGEGEYVEDSTDLIDVLETRVVE